MWVLLCTDAANHQPMRIQKSARLTDMVSSEANMGTADVFILCRCFRHAAASVLFCANDTFSISCRTP